MTQESIERLTRPIVGIENRSAQEAFDIMVNRIRGNLTLPQGDVELPDRLVKIGHFLTGCHEKDKARDVWEAGRLLRSSLPGAEVRRQALKEATSAASAAVFDTRGSAVEAIRSLSTKDD